MIVSKRGSKKVKCILEGIFFDLGGTMMHNPSPNIAHLEAMDSIKTTLGKYGHEIGMRPEEMRETLRECRISVRARTGHWKEVDERAVYRVMLSRLGVSPADNLIDQCIKVYRGVLANYIAYYPDVLPTISVLKTRGFKLGLISNAVMGVKFYIPKLRLRRYFNVLVFSYQVGWIKPRPEIFQYAPNRLGVAPEKSVMVGDSIKDDITGAKAQNMKAVLIRREEDDRPTQLNGEGRPDAIIAELREVVDLIEKWTKGSH